MMKPRLVWATFSVALFIVVCGCNRSALRIPGASSPFPKTPTGFSTKSTPYPHVLVVATPIDQRSQHYDEHVAGTKWTGCSTDPFWATNAPQVIRERLLKELETSGMFVKVVTISTSPDDVLMKTDINAFCAQTAGFLVARVAGITSLHITFEQNGNVLTDQKFEMVVTDADKEYTGSQVTTIEQAMRTTMADSLRELLKLMLKKIDAEVAAWKGHG
ncbi:hypothetical protein ACH50O_10965 [Methylomonas sp. 2BW1-5-20]|uniref:hypothetical protein n=1 Tax=Methylomonas sp. 2BW1-5-20 TaxID=3376686 RepID=UPI00404E0948